MRRSRMTVPYAVAFVLAMIAWARTPMDAQRPTIPYATEVFYLWPADGLWYPAETIHSDGVNTWWEFPHTGVPEVFVVVLDGCEINDRIWVKAAATTNMHVRIRVGPWFRRQEDGLPFRNVIDPNALPCQRDVLRLSSARINTRLGGPE